MKIKIYKTDKSQKCQNVMFLSHFFYGDTISRMLVRQSDRVICKKNTGETRQTGFALTK